MKPKLMIINAYGYSVSRGAETFTNKLAQELASDFEVIPVYGDVTQMPDHQFRGRWWHKLAKRLFIDPAGLAILKFSWQQLGSVVSLKPDWVMPLNGFWQVLLLKLLQPFIGYQLVIVGHSGAGWDERWNLYLCPNIFIATTPTAQIWAKKTAPWVQTKYIPLAIDFETFAQPSIKLNSKLKHQLEKLPRPLILCPAALVAYKRVDLAIKAVARLDSASLVITGKGELEAELRQLAGRLLPQRYLLTSLEYQQMPAVYQAVDLVTLPSLPQENSPMVFIEALAASKLVVCTDMSRARDILGKAGIYLDPADLEAYRLGLVRGLKGKKLAWSRLQKRYSWDKVAQEYRSVFSQVKYS